MMITNKTILKVLETWPVEEVFLDVQSKTYTVMFSNKRLHIEFVMSFDKEDSTIYMNIYNESSHIIYADVVKDEIQIDSAFSIKKAADTWLAKNLVFEEDTTHNCFEELI